MIGFCPLASGSKGNCIYLGTEHTKILIDVGISVRSLKEKLSQIDVHLEDIDAVLVTHEHTDHIYGLKTLCKNTSIPVLANCETAKGISRFIKGQARFKIFSTGESFEFSDLEIHPFTIQHDTPDPVAFTLQTELLKMGFCTDLGFASSLVEERLRHCDTLYLEANHTPSMVHASSRPMVYKQRVLGRHGHLSNEACAELVKKLMHDRLKRIYLAHLSEECNHPKVAYNTVHEVIKETEIDLQIAHQSQISEKTLFSNLAVLS